jgi:predicted small secreted protein
MRMKARVWVALALLVVAAPILSACYTTRGAGEDLKAAGNGIEHSADQHTNYKP